MTARRPWPAVLVALAAACTARHDIGAERFTQTLSRDVDVLFVIDDSGRIGESASTVASALPAFAEALATSVTSLHIGFITAAMGGATSGQCAGGGAFVTNSNCLDAPFVSLEGGAPNFKGSLGDVVRCLYPTSHGCPLQQPFAAARAALDPRSGKAPTAFLRQSADLVVVFVASQDDCSLAPGSDLFGSGDGGVDAGSGDGGADAGSGDGGADAGPRDGGANAGAALATDVAYACAAAGVMCEYQPLPAFPPASPVTLSSCESSEDPRLLTVADTAEFLVELKDDAKQVFVVLVGGPTAPFTIGPAQNLPATLQPSCQGNGMQVLPPARLQSLADKLHGNGFATSLCGADLTSQLANVAGAVASRSRCLGGQPRFSPGAGPGDGGADAASGLPLCEVRLAAGAASTSIPSCTAGKAPCFWMVANAVDCPGSGWQIDVETGQTPLPSGALEVDCLGLPADP